MNHSNPPDDFYGLGIAPKLLEILDRLNFKTPTPIQKQSIPIALEGKDVMGIAQTGTGKTLAFGIPMIQRLAQVKGSGLIVTPTRELALQIEESLQKIGKQINLRTATVIGGASMHTQIQQLKKRPHIIIATPGRLNDLIEQNKVRLNEVRILVLDEADRMLDMGFEPQIRRIVKHVPKERQTMLFSATMPGNIMRLTKEYMQLPVRVEIAKAGTTAEKVTQEVFAVKKEDKIRLLEKLLEEHRGTTLVFSRTKHGARKIARAIRDMGHTATELHSDRTLSQRKAALEGFKTGKFRILVATDIASRGIDVKNIELVINYDLPDSTEDYVHRIGRTGRAGRSGHAISFATPDQGRDVREIEKLTRTLLPLSELPELPKGRAPFGKTALHAHARSRSGFQKGKPQRFPSASESEFSANRPSRGKDRHSQHSRPERPYGRRGGRSRRSRSR